MSAPPDPGWRIEPLGDRCLVVEFGDRIEPRINATARAFAAHLLDRPIEGVVDVVPAFASVALHYRPEALGEPPGGAASFERLRMLVHAALAQDFSAAETEARTVEVPVCYGGEHGPDLHEVAAACGLTAQQVIERHAGSAHLVYMLGFAPGFAYLGGLDAALSVPRRATPRTRVPAGSVAIAREQSAVYPIETPGGWNLIGRTPLVLFDAHRDPPCLLRPGDRVRFVPIDAPRFESLRAHPA